MPRAVASRQVFGIETLIGEDMESAAHLEARWSW